MNLSPDIPDINGKPAFKGCIWTSTDQRSGYIWTPRAEKIGDLDLAGDQKISGTPAFDYNVFQHDPNVVSFRNGYGVNLYGVIMENGDIIQTGTELTYSDAKGQTLHGRLIEERVENGKRILSEKLY
jgi:hypothetical protein